MSNKKPFRNSRSCSVANEGLEYQRLNSSQSFSQRRHSFRNSAETSGQMDVSPETGMQESLAVQHTAKKPFRVNVTEPRAGYKRPFRKQGTENYGSSIETSVKHNCSLIKSEKRPFRSGDYSFKNEIPIEEQIPKNDPVGEAAILLTEMADKDHVPDEAENILQTAAEKLCSESNSPKHANDSKQEKSADNSADKSEKKSKSATKGKEVFSAAWVKDQILQKVPFIKHTGGLFAYNGRTYVAVNTSSQLVGIVINQVDEKMFGLTSTNIFTSVLTMLQQDERLFPTDYTERVIASEDIVVFKNTLLNIRTLKKIPFNPWYITSYEIDANYIAHPEPDVYIDFLNTASGGDSEIEDCITDCISYILSGSNQGKLFFVMGTAQDSGKSSLATFLQGVINEKYIFNVAPNEFKDRFSLGGNRGRILNISMDLPSSSLHSDVVATIKKITGGDRLMSQEKNEKKEFGVSSMRLLFGTNHAISVNSTDDNDAFWSRLQVIPFMYSVAPEDKDPHLVQRMLDERDDIVSYCIQRMPDIIERGYRLTPCQAAEEIKNEWRYGIPDSESLESFCDTFLEITGNKENAVLATDIYTAYREYCKSLDVKPLREEKIKEWFSDHGGECDRGRLSGMKNAQSLIYGVRFLENT